jgi:arsenate reductase (glutaredoxin)
MMRMGELVYSELGLSEAPRRRLLEAISEHSVLLERPIFVSGDRAEIARPPERVLELLSSGSQREDPPRRLRGGAGGL